MANQILEKLSKKRMAWVQSTKDNNFDGGINKLLTELYPDNAHFIYELLQNAEDAEATNASFDLTAKGLNFRHNGRLFNEADIDGITSIGTGTKADDINKIGKFGVGFKAVFSYTITPRIYSVVYNFEINNLVVPRELIRIYNKDDETVIHIPFNNPDKLPEKAYLEIKKGLIELQDTTLMFLDNISTINYTIQNKSFKISRQKIDNIQIAILNTQLGTRTKWLRFKKNVLNSQKLFVSVAFRIDTNEKEKREIIKPIKGQVSIFFPAEKETSNLKFHIHAPFSSTVARDSIKNLKENDTLLNSIADLLCESLDYLKEKDLLDFNFLACLPIEEDNLSEFYKPIQDQLIAYFNYGNYVLTEQGEYRRPIKCYRSSAAIKKVISKNDLKIILDIDEKKNVYWLKNPTQLNSREDKFLQALDIKSFRSNNLIEVLQSMIDDYTYKWADEIEKIRLETFLKNKSNEWLKKFYELLYDLIKKDDYSDFDEYLDFTLFIRLKSGQFNFDLANCFFDSESVLDNSKLNIIHKQVYEFDKNAKNQKSKLFLEELGVKDFGVYDEIKLILDDYDSGAEIEHNEHLHHLNLFIKYFEEKKEADIFEDRPLLINSKNHLVEADMILVDSPFKDTSLNLIQGAGGRLLLQDCYQDIENKELFVAFLKAIGANFSLPIEEESILHHPHYESLIEYGQESIHTINEDFFIYGLNKLKNKDIKLSLLVWKSISNCEVSYHRDIFTARYRRVKTSITNIAPSRLLLELKKHAWIPDKNGEFHKPQDITAEELHQDFVYNNENGWLTKIGFGENIKNNPEYQEREKLIKEETGFSPNVLRKAKDAGFNDEDLEKFINEKISKDAQILEKPNLVEAIQKHSKQINNQTIELSPAILINEEEYRKKAQKRLDSNIRKSTNNVKIQLTEQKIKVGKLETREFLKQQYKGYCQVCGFTFNQKENKGNYFEAFDWLSEKISAQQNNIVEAGSSLSLCSRCHSAIKYGDFDATVIEDISDLGDLNELNFTEFTDLLNAAIRIDNVPDVYNFIELDMYKIPIRLLNEEQNIFYTEEHFLQFFNLLTLGHNIRELPQKEHSLKDNTSNDFIELNNKSNNELVHLEKEFEVNGGIVKSSNNEIIDGSRVIIKYLKTNQVAKITIVQQKINKIFKKGEYVVIDNNTPLAQILMGHSAKDIVKMGEKTEILIENVLNDN